MPRGRPALPARCIAALLCAAVILLVVPRIPAAQGGQSIRVLFLGDRGHHKPGDRFKQLQPVFAARQIDLVYTESMEDLNRSKLGEFDCLLIYANVTKISPEQEKALLSFVQEGGGLVPLHCASYCFHNSSKYIELVGAQFKRHGTGVFQETIVATNDPVMKGLAPIESWDETYVHARHNTNRIVLAERRDAEGAEPWTWVRQEGAGRVFYTAWGHDQRTWSNAGFQDLVERGIRWASGNAVSKLKARTGLKPFEYVEAPGPLPNYTPGAQWGTQGEPIRRMQQPLSPAESQQHLVTAPEFETRLFAAEPDIVKPIWLSWDARGRLWIAETLDYPNELKPEGQGRDRLKICEDTDGDGRADKFTIFADRLSIPTGFVFANGGVIVIHSGKTEFFKDTNGDDRADERRVLFSGWGMKDTHATASNLRYGFDNWIWGTVGYSGFEGTIGGKSVRFGQGFFRFKPDGSALEFVRSSNNNTWGLGLSEDNVVFGSTANGNASMYMPIPNRFYEVVRGWSASRLETIADSQRFYALTEKVRQVDWHGRYTAGAGSALYTARNFPAKYWNCAQFVAEPTGHLLGQFFLQQDGANFIAHNAGNFAASDDEWTAPICAEVGPDGALWMIDWYNYVVQHNPTPRGFDTGKGNAYVTPLRDQTHGRIYRIVYRNATAPAAPRLDGAKPDQLLAALKDSNMLWRMHAQRMLVARAQKDVVPALVELTRDKSVDALGLNVAAIHALWTLEGLGAFADANAIEAATAALKHPSAAVRRAAVTVMPRTEASLKAILRGNLLDDAEPLVRLATLLAIAELPPNSGAGEPLLAAVQRPANAGDRWLMDAVTCAGARHADSFLRAALTAAQVNESATRALHLVAAHYAHGKPGEIVSVLQLLPKASTIGASAVLEGLIAGWPSGEAPTLDPSQREKLTRLMAALPDEARDRLLSLAQRWGQTDLFGTTLTTVVASLKTQITDPSLAISQRTNAAKRLIALEDQSGTMQTILAQVTLLSPPDLANGFIQALAESRNAALAGAVIERWPHFTPAVRRTALVLLMRRREWTMTLLDSIQDGAIGKTELAAEHWAQLKQNPSRGIAGRAERLAGMTAAVSSDREALVTKLLPLAREKGDPQRGHQVFTANCASCHTFNGEGKTIGPDLTGIGSRDRTEILTDIIDPNRSVEANYRAWTVSTKDGEMYSGRLDAETQSSIELLDTSSQKHVIQRQEIASLQASALSIMPVGFESLSPDDLKGLLEFLTRHEGPATSEVSNTSGSNSGK